MDISSSPDAAVICMISDVIATMKTPLINKRLTKCLMVIFNIMHAYTYSGQWYQDFVCWMKTILKKNFQIKNNHWITAWGPFDFIQCDVLEIRVLLNTYLWLISFTFKEAKHCILKKTSTREILSQPRCFHHTLYLIMMKNQSYIRYLLKLIE